MIFHIPWQRPYDFNKAKATFINAWPIAWQELAPETTLIYLSQQEIKALGSQIAGFQHWFTPISPKCLIHLAERLDTAINNQGRSSFIRLVSRSPKDSLYSQRHGMRVTNGSQALALIIEGSERCAADLRMVLDEDETTAIVVRKWIDFPPWREFRCFMRDYQWIGASQALHSQKNTFLMVDQDYNSVLKNLDQIMKRITASSHIADAVFDIVCPLYNTLEDELELALLLDSNPLSPDTDLALFASINELDKTFRFYSEKNNKLYIVSTPLP